MNEELFDKLFYASEYYRISDQHDAIVSRFCDDIANCKYKYAEMKNKKNSPVALNILSIWMGTGFWVMTLAHLVATEPKPFLAFLSLILAIGTTIVFPIWYSKHCKKSKKHAKKADEYWYKELAPIVAKDEENIARANKEWKAFAEANKDIIEFLPQPYRNYSATSYMAIAVGKCRADTFKEAANLYEEQLHRWRLEAINEEIAAQNWAIQNNLNALGEQQAEANKHLKNIENLEFFNTWFSLYK